MPSSQCVRRGRVALLLLTAAVLLPACSGDTDNWRWPGSDPTLSRSVPELEVPPDLRAEELKETLAVPGTAAAAQRTPLLPNVAGIRLRRIGDERWLEIDMPAEALWGALRDFWIDQGFVIFIEDAAAGFIQTDWIEERVDPKPGFFANIFIDLSTAFQGALLRDRYRMRLERGERAGVSEIYISHNGTARVIVSENSNVAANDRSEKQFWQSRPSDPELEAVMLQRLIVFFGPAEEQASELIASALPRTEYAQRLDDDNGPLLLLTDPLPRAWRRLGLVLDRTGFTVERNNRSIGVYYVRYLDPDRPTTNSAGFLAKLAFWRSEEESSDEGEQYLIRLAQTPKGDTHLAVLNSAGERDASATAKRILEVLYEQLK